MQERVYIVQTPVRDTSRCDQRLEAAPRWHMGKHITKRHQWSSWSMEKVTACKHEGKRTSLWTSAKLKPALFRVNTQHNRLFAEPPTVYRRKHVVSRHFHRSYLKANKLSKSEGTRKVKYAYNFWMKQGSHQATKIKFPDIPGRFLKIRDGASSIYHFSGRLHSPTLTPCHHLSMQVSVLLDISSTYNCCI